MNIPKDVLNSALYHEVVNLGKRKKVSVRFKEYSDDSKEANIGLGFTNFNQISNVIEIGIITSNMSNDIVFIHELLHAKLHLMDYPSIERYKEISIHPFINEVLMSLQNTVHHTFVYREMKILGLNQNKIDDSFFTFIEKQLETGNKGVAKLALVINLLEAHVRDKVRTGNIVRKIEGIHKKELELYFQMREIINEPLTPYGMRMTFCKLIKIVDDFIKEETNEKLYLNIIIKVDPAFSDSMLSKKASDVLYTIKLPGYPHVFVMDKINKQCCLFLSRNGQPLEKSYFDDILSQYKLNELLSIL